MALPMCRPTKHPKSGVYRVRMRVPKDILRAIGTGERIVSLGTKDPKEALRLAPAACAKIRAEFTAARASLGPVRRLSHREVLALAGEWYRDRVAFFEDDPGEASDWDLARDLMLDKLEALDAEGAAALKRDTRDCAEARRFLAERGVAADDDSVTRLAMALIEAQARAAQTLAKRAAGDYSPDPVVARYPEPKRPQDAKPPLPAADLLDAWAAERKPAPATREKYAGTFRTIARVLDFDDVRRITAEDVVRFKRHRLEVEKRDPGTVEDDIRSAGTVAKWGVKNLMLASNPFDGLAPKAVRKLAARVPYDDDDARRILTAARKETGWLRWGPWLLCFTGARIGELAELRRGDMREEDGVSFLDIRPHEARPGKNATMQRMIPLHPALVAEGFLDYVAGLPADPDGPLFPSIAPDPHGKRTTPAQTKLGRWIRFKVKITDEKKAPAHAWRHRMEDELRKVRALPEVVDAITGRNNPRNAGAAYGKGFRGMPAEVLKELGRIPSPVSPR